MSRIYYDDDDDPQAYGRWQGRVKQALHSRRGLASLRELESALLAMPSHELAADYLASGNAVCAIGAICSYRRVQKQGMTWEEAIDDLPRGIDDEFEMQDIAQNELKMTRTLAWLIMEQNDEETIGMSDTERWQHVLDWTRSRIAAAEVV